MTKRVLITGSPGRVESLAKIFAAAGVEQVTMAQADAGAIRIDCWVQLGVTVPARGDTIVRRVHSFLTDGLLDRFTAAERVLPILTDDAIVLLVAGNLPAAIAAPDDRAARLSLLKVLAHAMRADLAPTRVRIRVIRNDQSDEDIVESATTGAEDPQTAAPDGARNREDSEIGRSYEDWRNQILGLAQVEF